MSHGHDDGCALARDFGRSMTGSRPRALYGIELQPLVLQQTFPVAWSFVAAPVVSPSHFLMQHGLLDRPEMEPIPHGLSSVKTS